MANALPILTASVFAVAAAVLTGLLPPAKAYAGFANGTILLIVLAFLVARSVVKCGLGARIGHLLVSRFGRSTLGLSYSIFLVDGIIAPAFPSNTARSGVIFPLAFSLADAAGAKPGDEQPSAPRQLPDVLGHRQPEPLVRAVADGDGRQSDGRGDRETLRRGDGIRILAAGRIGPDPGRPWC